MRLVHDMHNACNIFQKTIATQYSAIDHHITYYTPRHVNNLQGVFTAGVLYLQGKCSITASLM